MGCYTLCHAVDMGRGLAVKVIIAGGRDHIPTMAEDAACAMIFNHNDITEIVEGGASGVDSWARDLARKLGIKCITFSADWAKHGRAAGPLRNRAMANYADAVILLAGGKGTDSMRREAMQAGIKTLYDAKH